MIFNLKNTVSQFKRLIGRKFSDPVVQDEKKRLSCQLVERPGDCIGVKVRIKVPNEIFFLFRMFTSKIVQLSLHSGCKLIFLLHIKRINFFCIIMKLLPIHLIFIKQYIRFL